MFLLNLYTRLTPGHTASTGLKQHLAPLKKVHQRGVGSRLALSNPSLFAVGSSSTVITLVRESLSLAVPDGFAACVNVSRLICSGARDGNDAGPFNIASKALKPSWA